jgi:antitoxin VapB
MAQSSVFKSNKSQAIRLPRSVALPEHVKRVDIFKVGNGRLVVPAGGGWDEFFANHRLDDDFLKDRDQPPPQERGD